MSLHDGVSTRKGTQQILQILMVRGMMIHSSKTIDLDIAIMAREMGGPQLEIFL